MNENNPSKRLKVFMWEITSSTADFLFNASNVLLLIGSVVVLIATIGTITMGMAKEHFSDLRLSENEKVTAEAKKEAAIANAKAAEANLLIQKLRAPRALSKDQQEEIIKKVQSFKGQRYSASLPASSLDSGDLWRILDATLTRAGWIRDAPAGAAVGNPPAGIIMAAPVGILVMTRPDASDEVKAAAMELINILNSLGLDAKPSLIGDHKETRNYIITLVIGLKPA